MNNLIQVSPLSEIERVIVSGDLSKLSPDQRIDYYRALCTSLGLNPLTKPFEYLVLSGRMTLYATRNATDQLRALHGISVEIVSRERLDDIYVVVAKATAKDGRSDTAIGAVSVAGLRGDALANALMKAETKAKRRVTLSLVGLSFLDETEVETVPGAQILKEDDTVENIPSGSTAQNASTPAGERPRVEDYPDWAESVPLDIAISEKSSDGQYYIVMSSEALAFRLRSIVNRLSKGGLSDDEQETYARKKQVVEAILSYRSKHS